MMWRKLAFCILLLALGACVRGPKGSPESALHKIEFDLTRLDEHGLRGPKDGKVAVAYEFAIPDTPECRAEIAAIDPTIEFMSGSRGRIGASEGEVLCIGSTHQPDHRRVLERLAELPYVDRIIECHFE